MARPKLPPHEMRSQSVAFRVSPIDHASLLAAASAHGIKVGELARRRSLGVRLPPEVQDAALRADTVAALNRIGVNLNQLVKRLNAGGPLNVEKLINTLDRVHDAMDRLDESD